MIMRWIFLLILVALTTIGCAANCTNVQEKLNTCQTTLTDQDYVIKKQEATIRQKDQKIAEQVETIDKLKIDIAELDRKLGIVTTEKGRSHERIKDIATSVREYIKNQMRDNRNFLTGIALEDFIGDELIARANTGEEGILVVNVENPVPSGGQINGIGGYFTAPGDMVFKLLRPAGNDFIVIYDKKISVAADQPGEQHIDFDSPFIAKKGDIIAYYFPGPVNVPYDNNIGTTAYLQMQSDQYPHGSRIASADIWQAKQIQRKYSLNYYGIFYTRVDE